MADFEDVTVTINVNGEKKRVSCFGEYDAKYITDWTDKHGSFMTWEKCDVSITGIYADEDNVFITAEILDSAKDALIEVLTERDLEELRCPQL